MTLWPMKQGHKKLNNCPGILSAVDILRTSSKCHQEVNVVES